MRIFHSILIPNLFVIIVAGFTVGNYEIRDLESGVSYFQTEATSWTVTNLVLNTSTFQCSGTWLLGGYLSTGNGVIFARSYPTIPTHAAISFSIEVWLLDINTFSALFNLFFDGFLVNSWNWNLESDVSLSSNKGTCAESGESFKSTIIRGISMHSASSVAVRIESSSNLYGFALGIRNVNLLFQAAIPLYTVSSCDYYAPLFSSSSCLCANNQYSLSLSACLACNTLCGTCLNSASASFCTSCTTGSSYDGSACVQCSSPCAQCNSSTPSICTRCQSGMYLFKNGTCSSGCPSPLVPTTQGEYTSCSNPCSSPQPYLYDNSTCGSSCSSPYTQVNTTDASYCKMVCVNSTPYLYWNDTCQSYCPYPLVNTTQGSTLYCKLPCNSTNRYYYNGTNSCLSKCNFPLINQTTSDLWLCRDPCSSTEYLYWDYTCRASCTAPLLSISGQYYQSCTKPCQSDQFLYPNGSCLSTCNFTHQTSADGVQSCIYPCNTTQYWYSSLLACDSECQKPNIAVKIDSYLTECIIVIEGPTPSAAVVAIASAASYLASGNIFRPSNPHSVFMISFTKMLKYVKFINANIPEEFLELLDSGNISSKLSISTAFGYPMPDYISDTLTKHPLPKVFENVGGYHSSYLVNFWSGMSSYSILIGLCLVFSIFERAARRSNHEKLKMVIERFVIITRWNFLLIVTFNSFDDMTLFAIFELQTLHMDSYLAAISLTMCLSISIMSLYFLYMGFVISRQTFKNKSKILPVTNELTGSEEEPFAERWRAWQLLYAGYKPGSFLKAGCLLFQTIRVIFSYIIVGFLYDYPLVQVSLITFSSFVMILYFVTTKPFKDRFNLAVTVLYEFIILLVNLCLLGLVLLKASNKLNSSNQVLLSEIIIVANSTVDMMGNILTWLYLVLGIWYMYKETRSCNFRGKLCWMNLVVCVYEGPGMNLDDDAHLRKERIAKGSLISLCKAQPLKSIESDLKAAFPKKNGSETPKDNPGPKFKRKTVKGASKLYKRVLEPSIQSFRSTEDLISKDDTNVESYDKTTIFLRSPAMENSTIISPNASHRLLLAKSGIRSTKSPSGSFLFSAQRRSKWDDVNFGMNMSELDIERDKGCLDANSDRHGGFLKEPDQSGTLDHSSTVTPKHRKFK